ncbi:MAG: hypothetical protein ACXAC5_02105 [Promethearchaeota archaeon]|jgi:hypothetical protein
MPTRLKVRKKFKVDQCQPEKRKVISLHISAQLDETVQKAAKDHNVTKQALIRQMTILSS